MKISITAEELLQLIRVVQGQPVQAKPAPMEHAQTEPVVKKDVRSISPKPEPARDPLWDRIWNGDASTWESPDKGAYANYVKPDVETEETSDPDLMGDLFSSDLGMQSGNEASHLWEQEEGIPYDVAKEIGKAMPTHPIAVTAIREHEISRPLERSLSPTRVDITVSPDNTVKVTPSPKRPEPKPPKASAKLPVITREKYEAQGFTKIAVPDSNGAEIKISFD